MHYAPSNYVTWWFADDVSTGHSFSTGSNFLKTREWYYLAATVDYTNGKYSGYSYFLFYFLILWKLKLLLLILVFDSKREVKYNYSRAVTANKG